MAIVLVMALVFLMYLLIAILFGSELSDGIAVYDENGEFIGNSKRAAVKAITQVVTSRITIAAPGMCKLYAFVCIIMHPCVLPRLVHYYISPKGCFLGIYCFEIEY